jgi:hypothetical protein
VSRILQTEKFTPVGRHILGMYLRGAKGVVAEVGTDAQQQQPAAVGGG